MFFTKDLCNAHDLQHEMNKIFDQLNFRFVQPSLHNHKNLPVNIQGNKEEATISVEAPGVNAEDIDISIEKNVVHISVVRQRDINNKKYYLKERRQGNWKRSIQLGFDINEEKVDASYAKGILYIHVTKQQQGAPRKITVKKA